LFLFQTTWRATVSVCVVLVGACVLTGFISSAYKNERQSLGRSHYEAAQSLVTHGDVREAIAEYRKALLFSPDQPEYRLSLATALLNAGRLSEAKSHLEQLLQEDPTNGRINLLLARVAVRQHRTPAAMEYYQRAVYEYWPTWETDERRQARWELIELLGRTGERNELVGELMQLYANLPPDPEQRLRVGSLLLKNGALSEASQVFRDLVRQVPQNAQAHEGLAEVYFSSGDYVAARHEYQRASRYAPRNQEIADGLALTNQVIDIDPELPYIPYAERLRRSQNLVNRILKDLQPCAGAKDRIAAAQNLLTAKPAPGTDLPLQLEDTAQQLWKDRASLCGQTAVSDRAVEAVLPRITHE